jgi:hypothetical protein
MTAFLSPPISVPNISRRHHQPRRHSQHRCPSAAQMPATAIQSLAIPPPSNACLPSQHRHHSQYRCASVPARIPAEPFPSLAISRRSTLCLLHPRHPQNSPPSTQENAKPHPLLTQTLLPLPPYTLYLLHYIFCPPPHSPPYLRLINARTPSSSQDTRGSV